MDVQIKRFYELHLEKFNQFKSQNSLTGDFDVIFEFGEQKLDAHKSKLCDVSNTFNSMPSERWTSPNQPIKIETYSFEDFKEFLTFIYSGDCNLSNKNISSMIDIAEFYIVKVLKKTCEEFLLKTFGDLESFYPKLELAYKYSMDELKQSLLDYIKRNFLKLIEPEYIKILEIAFKNSMNELKEPFFNFISKNFSIFVKSDYFQSLQKPMIVEIVKLNKNTVRQEEFFEMVYKWAENRALEEKTLNKDLNLNEYIKAQLSILLPYFKYNLMNTNFLFDFVVKKSFLFCGIELSNILKSAKYLISFVDSNGRMIKGILNCPDIDRVFHIIQSNKNIVSNSFWETVPTFKPSEDSKVKKNNSTNFYLVYEKWLRICNGDPYHKFGVQKYADLRYDSYLLAELVAESNFNLGHCKIV